MREILFRGKVVKSDPDIAPADGWVEGFYYQDLCGGEVKHFIVSCPCAWEVVPATVGQYTGLKDKNGKEIYEGDILEHNGKIVGHVIGGVRYYCYDVIYKQPAPEKDWSLYGVVVNDYRGDVEVIGNIHDNPELLK